MEVEGDTGTSSGQINKADTWWPAGLFELPNQVLTTADLSEDATLSHPSDPQLIILCPHI